MSADQPGLWCPHQNNLCQRALNHNTPRVHRYGGLDNVIADAETKDPRVAKKLREPYIFNGKLIDNGCDDKNENCSWWASIGECQKNPGCVFVNPRENES